MNPATRFYGLLECLRPIRPKESCIYQVLCFRRYNSHNCLEQKYRNSLKSWNQAKLSEVDSIHDPAEVRTLAKPVSATAVLGTFDSAADAEKLKMQNEIRSAFASLPRLVKDLSELESLERYHDIHQLFKTHKSILPTLKKDFSIDLYSAFLRIVLKAEFALRNYVVCESLFSEYIKIPNIEPGIVDIGLVTFLKNRNLPLAKEFYVQILKDPDTFPLSPRTLHVFALEVFKVSDLALMKQVIFSWLDSPQLSSLTPLSETFSLFHQLLFKYDDIDGISRFLTHPRVLASGYETSDDFALCSFHQSLLIGELGSVEEIDEYLQKVFETTQNSRRLNFYMEVIEFGISKNKFSLVRFATAKAQNDASVELTDEFHIRVCRYFVKNGLLNALVQYLTRIVIKSSGCHINHVYVEQLWCCAVKKYPILFKEFTNDFCLLLDQEKANISQSEWGHLVSDKIRISSFKVENSKRASNKYAALSSHFSPECAKAIQEAFVSGDATSARTKMLSELQHGIKPSFAVLYLLLKFFMEESLEAARIVDQIMRETYPKIPIKVDILWLKYNAIRSANFMDRNSVVPAVELEASQIEITKVKDFERERRMHLNFQNYMQLSSISLVLRDAKTAVHMLERGKKRMDPSNERDWYIYYSSALKVHTRARDPVKFLLLLREWNNNDSAQLITRDSLRSCKGFVKYFAKHAWPYEQTITRRDIMAQIDRELDALLARYVNYKFQGLNDMRMVSHFLRDWISTDLRSELYCTSGQSLDDGRKLSKK
ncbi:LAME_0E02278g1_1 [Lachancea meyersii CBS 8951]|uniref:LAME_0E02278g1_1 n=1 Tax=Lachancea meyersii CBS 8951 TaxID=1266667 RepID=A0A1G4JGI7_9SACH|nr:LAME_0E02278g1_1 [Lachancea meyersii CBS 8951]